MSFMVVRSRRDQPRSLGLHPWHLYRWPVFHRRRRRHRRLKWSGIWGVDRLRLLVEPQLREKFDRQRYLFNQAIQNGDLEAVRRESARMIAAWRTLDAAAQTAGKQPLSREVWEVALADGSVAAIVPDAAHAAQVVAEGRKLAVYTLDEIARLLSEYRAIVATKLSFPGATITAVGPSVIRSMPSPMPKFRLTIPFRILRPPPAD